VVGTKIYQDESLPAVFGVESGCFSRDAPSVKAETRYFTSSSTYNHREMASSIRESRSARPGITGSALGMTFRPRYAVLVVV